MNLRLELILLCFCFSTLAFSQVESEVNPPDYIKTITFKSNTNESQLPILKLNERLQLEFDVLNGEEDDYYYVIEYYNFDWTPNKTLLKSEYLQGIDNVRIVNYENSFNTYQIYSHYKLQIPNYQTQLKISGNYMLKIYNDFGELMFTRKFMIYENQSSVDISIKRSRDVRFVQEKQSVDFKISSASMLINNPKRTINAVIIQNNNLNTVISNLKPLYTIGRDLIYKYDTESSFWAGNEYLYFENKDVRGANVGVQFVDLQDIYHHYLFTNTTRANKPYTYNPDLNGNFLITALNATDVTIEADYTKVHFSLLHPELSNNKSIHVYGNFNNYAITEETKMTLNPRTGNFETILTLKQGFYNYKHVIVNNDDGTIDEGAISGNFWETENSYKVLVYYRDLGARLDRIIGYGEGNSTNISN